MKTLTKKLKNEQRRNKELMNKMESMERAKRQAEEIIRNRDIDKEKLRAMLQAGNKFLYALASAIGEEFEISYDALNNPAEYVTCQTDDGIKFKRKPNIE